MGETISQLGVGGILVVLVLREVLPWVAKKRSAGGNGNGSAQYCKMQNPDAAKLYMIEIGKEVSSNLETQLSAQTALLREIRDGLLKGRT